MVLEINLMFNSSDRCNSVMYYFLIACTQIKVNGHVLFCARCVDFASFYDYDI